MLNSFARYNGVCVCVCVYLPQMKLVAYKSACHAETTGLSLSLSFLSIHLSVKKMQQTTCTIEQNKMNGKEIEFVQLRIYGVWNIKHVQTAHSLRISRSNECTPFALLLLSSSLPSPSNRHINFYNCFNIRCVAFACHINLSHVSACFKESKKTVDKGDDAMKKRAKKIPSKQIGEWASAKIEKCFAATAQAIIYQKFMQQLGRLWRRLKEKDWQQSRDEKCNSERKEMA